VTLDFTSHSVEQTCRIGACLGELLLAGDIICLAGGLGAGKTVLAQGIGEGWGALEAVTSPTFTLVHEHHRAKDGQALYHIDCYRLHEVAEARGIGLDDLLYGDGPMIIEWPEHIQAILPSQHLWITLTILDDTRRQIVIDATGERYEILMEAFRHNSVR
jgi:tRNA threonylcarbamoyladenosine biosynthesis protein TsaE